MTFPPHSTTALLSILSPKLSVKPKYSSAGEKTPSVPCTVSDETAFVSSSSVYAFISHGTLCALFTFISVLSESSAAFAETSNVISFAYLFMTSAFLSAERYAELLSPTPETKYSVFGCSRLGYPKESYVSASRFISISSPRLPFTVYTSSSSENLSFSASSAPSERNIAATRGFSSPVPPIIAVESEYDLGITLSKLTSPLSSAAAYPRYITSESAYFDSSVSS